MKRFIIILLLLLPFEIQAAWTNYYQELIRLPNPGDPYWYPREALNVGEYKYGGITRYLFCKSGELPPNGSGLGQRFYFFRDEGLPFGQNNAPFTDYDPFDPDPEDVVTPDATYIGYFNSGYKYEHFIAEGEGPNIFTPHILWDMDRDGTDELIVRIGDGNLPTTYDSTNVAIIRIDPIAETFVLADSARWPYSTTASSLDDEPRYLTVAYLDGYNNMPSVVCTAGLHDWSFVWVYDVDENLHLSVRDTTIGGTIYTFQWTNEDDGNTYLDNCGGQNIYPCDVNQDGDDEILWGTICLDDESYGANDWKLWYVRSKNPGEENYGAGHADYFSVGDIVPDNPGLEVFYCVEGAYASTYVIEAENGNVVWYDRELNNIWSDINGGWLADIDPDREGLECGAFNKAKPNEDQCKRSWRFYAGPPSSGDYPEIILEQLIGEDNWYDHPLRWRPLGGGGNGGIAAAIAPAELTQFGGGAGGPGNNAILRRWEPSYSPCYGDSCEDGTENTACVPLVGTISKAGGASPSDEWGDSREEVWWIDGSDNYMWRASAFTDGTNAPSLRNAFVGGTYRNYIRLNYMIHIRSEDNGYDMYPFWYYGLADNYIVAPGALSGIGTAGIYQGDYPAADTIRINVGVASGAQ